MTKDTKKINAVKEAIDKKLRELYELEKKSTPEIKNLEYLMCLIEADPDSPDYALSCSINMYK